MGGDLPTSRSDNCQGSGAGGFASGFVHGQDVSQLCDRSESVLNCSNDLHHTGGLCVDVSTPIIRRRMLDCIPGDNPSTLIQREEQDSFDAITTVCWLGVQQ